MKKYLKIIGIIELVSYVIGAIAWFVLIFALKMLPIIWLYYFIYLFFAPAFGVVCIGVSTCLERLDEIDSREIAKQPIKGTSLGDIVILKETIDYKTDVLLKGTKGKVLAIIGNLYRVKFLIGSKEIKLDLDESKITKNHLISQ